MRTLIHWFTIGQRRRRRKLPSCDEASSWTEFSTPAFLALTPSDICATWLILSLYGRQLWSSTTLVMMRGFQVTSFWRGPRQVRKAWRRRHERRQPRRELQ